MKQQYLFFAYFESDTSQHDRTEVFDEPKDLNDFVKWIKHKREEIEKLVRGTVIVKDIKFITHTII